MIQIADVYADIRMEIRARLQYQHSVGAIVHWLACRYHDEGRDEYKRVLGGVTRAVDMRGWLETFCEGE